MGRKRFGRRPRSNNILYAPGTGYAWTGVSGQSPGWRPPSEQHSPILNSTRQSKFGETSIGFPGELENKLTVSGSAQADDFNWGSGEWTVDFWLNVPNNQNRTIMSKCPTGDNPSGCSFRISTTESGYLSFDRKDGVGGCSSSFTTVSASGVSALVRTFMVE